MQLWTSVRQKGGVAPRIGGFVVAIALLAGVVAAPARADSDFENAFERSLGHLLAFEAVAASRALLFPGVAYPAPAPAYYPAPVAVVQPVPVAVPVAVPIAVPYYQAAYPVPVARPVFYRAKHYGHGHYGHGRGHGRGHGNWD